MLPPRSNRLNRGEVVRVFYLVNRMAPESIPLELTHYLRSDDLELHVAIFYLEGRPAPVPGDVTVHHLTARNAVDVRAVSRLLRVIRDVRPDVIHAHHTFSAACGLSIGKALRVPGLMKTEHNVHTHYSPPQLLLNLLSLTSCDIVACNSAATLRSFRAWERPLANRKARVVHNGVAVDTIRATARQEGPALRRQLDLPDDAVVVGSVGRLVEQKSYMTLIEAFAHMEATDKTFLLLVGGGPQEDALRDRCDSLGVSERIRFTGPIARTEVYAHLGAMDLFVVPSRWEGFCNAAVEAMVAGLPLVASDIDTLREVVGPHARYFEPGSASGLRTVLDDVIQLSDAERREWGRGGAKWAQDLYAVQRTAQEYLSAYRELAQRSPRVPTR